MNKEEKDELVEEAQQYLGEEVVYRRTTGDVKYVFTGIGSSVCVSEDNSEGQYFI